MSSLNIGGGPCFNYPGWLNLDAAAAPAFAFSPTCTFPLADQSIDLAYSSHCLEHLDAAAVECVLAETHRVLKPDAPFVVKLPDWEDVLRQWRAGNDAYFAGQWGFEAVAHTWDHDSITARASMIFCGYWNAAWGDHFRGERPGPGAYHGPARVPDAVAEALFEQVPADPKEALWEFGKISGIARTLSSVVRKTEPRATFNHQSAWALHEFAGVVRGRFDRFEWESSSPDQIQDDYRSHIPTLDDMAAISTYYEFVRR